MMENYYRNFYPYGFYSPSKFPSYPYGRYTYKNNVAKGNEKVNKIEIPYQNEAEFKQQQSETRNLDNKSSPIFEIFGIKLFFDDILLISLIFFLYNEGVKDQNLFISLILLLLS